MKLKHFLLDLHTHLPPDASSQLPYLYLLVYFKGSLIFFTQPSFCVTLIKLGLSSNISHSASPQVPWTNKIPALQPLTTCASSVSVKTQRTKLHFKLIRTENKQLTRYLDNKQKDDFGNSSECSFKFGQEEVCKQR